MAKDAGHGDRTGAPGTAKVEIKHIVLDILISANWDLRLSIYHLHGINLQFA